MIKGLHTIAVPNVVASVSEESLMNYETERKNSEAELAKALQEGHTLFATHTMVVDKVGYVVYVLVKEE